MIFPEMYVIFRCYQGGSGAPRGRNIVPKIDLQFLSLSEQFQCESFALIVMGSQLLLIVWIEAGPCC